MTEDGVDVGAPVTTSLWSRATAEILCPVNERNQGGKVVALDARDLLQTGTFRSPLNRCEKILDMTLNPDGTQLHCLYEGGCRQIWVLGNKPTEKNTEGEKAGAIDQEMSQRRRQEVPLMYRLPGSVLR